VVYTATKMSGAISHFAGSCDDLKKLVAKAAGVVVLDFFADWCGPCQQLGAELPKIAADFPKVKFVKLDIDQNPGIANTFQVRAVPFVQFVKKKADNNDEIENLATVIGADIPRIRKTLQQYQ
jgi:thioredoxin 1